MMSIQTVQKMGIILALAVTVALILLAKHQKYADPEVEKGIVEQRHSSLPQLIDLGAKKCLSCKMMTPVLEELKAVYANQFSVTFYDVWEDDQYVKQYGIKSIPTQIFIDEKGKELFRHEGFFSKEDILNKWKELGYNFRIPN